MKHSLAGLCVSLAVLSANASFAQVTTSKMTTTTHPSSTIESMKPLHKPPTKTVQPTAPLTLPPMIKPPPLVPQRLTYLHPGILVYRNGIWEGSDHLLNLSHQIGVYVSLLKPENEALAISEAEIKKLVEAIFSRVGIQPLTLAPQGSPPLPAFEIEILMYPISRGYVAYCGGRLFESVTLERFVLDHDMAFQAITWDKETLIVGPKAKFIDQLKSTVQEIAEVFADHFQTYERIKRALNY